MPKKVSDYQRSLIVDNDQKAQDEMRELITLHNAGVINSHRFARLRANVEGKAIRRWREDGDPMGLYDETEDRFVLAN
jgi:hypothetical protein